MKEIRKILENEYSGLDDAISAYYRIEKVVCAYEKLG